MLQLSQRPLTASAADAALFVDRSSELQRLGRAVDLGLNSLVIGDRGSGRTSLLHRFGRSLAERDAVAYVDGNRLAVPRADADDLFHAVVDAVAARGSVLEPEPPSPIGSERLAVLPRDTIVLVDDIDPDIAQDAFGRHRDELWQLPITWVVTGATNVRSRLLAPPADAFFDNVVELGELSEQAALELLLARADAARPGEEAARRVRVAAAVIARETAPRTPRALLAGARNLLLSDEHGALSVHATTALQAAAASAGRPAAMLFTELLDRGPVSASDNDLQQSLGWTRSRIVQVLKELEARNLVVATTASQGRGRPRTLYSVNWGNREKTE